MQRIRTALGISAVMAGAIALAGPGWAEMKTAPPPGTSYQVAYLDGGNCVDLTKVRVAVNQSISTPAAASIVDKVPHLGFATAAPPDKMSKVAIDANVGDALDYVDRYPLKQVGFASVALVGKFTLQGQPFVGTVIEMGTQSLFGLGTIADQGIPVFGAIWPIGGDDRLRI